MRFKLYNPQKESSEKIDLDSKNSLIDGDFLIKLNKKKKFEALGAISDELYEKIKSLPSNKLIPVFIWAKADIAVVNKENIFKDFNTFLNYQDEKDIELEFARENIISILNYSGIFPDYEFKDAPIVRATLRVDEIFAISKEPDIAYIFLDPGAGFPTSENYIYAVDANIVHSWGITGKGKKIAIEMMPRPHDSTYLQVENTMNPNGSTDSIATAAVGFIKDINHGNRGIAYNSLTYMANMDRTGYRGSYATAEEWALAQGCRIISYGWALKNGYEGRVMQGHDMYIDYLVKNYPYPLFVGSAGNSNGVDNQPCSQDENYQHVQNHFFNGLIVGGSNDKGTVSKLDDTMYECSSWKNPADFYDRELLHIVAPAKRMDGGGVSNIDGTSGAASVVAGIAALVVQKNPALEIWPEALRAIIMASAWTDIDGRKLELTNEHDDRDGTGLLSAARAVELSNSSNKINGGNTPVELGFDYGTMYFNTDFPNNYYYEEYYMKVPPNSDAQIILVWDSTANCPRTPNSDYNFCDTNIIDADLDLYVYDQFGTLKYYSLSWDNNFEYVKIPNNAPIWTEWKIKIKKYSTQTVSTYFSIVFDVYSKFSIDYNICPEPTQCNLPFNSETKQISVYPSDSPKTKKFRTGEIMNIYQKGENLIRGRLLDITGSFLSEEFLFYINSAMYGGVFSLSLVSLIKPYNEFIIAWRNYVGASHPPNRLAALIAKFENNQFKITDEQDGGINMCHRMIPSPYPQYPGCVPWVSDCNLTYVDISSIYINEYGRFVIFVWQENEYSCQKDSEGNCTLCVACLKKGQCAIRGRIWNIKYNPDGTTFKETSSTAGMFVISHEDQGFNVYTTYPRVVSVSEILPYGNPTYGNNFFVIWTQKKPLEEFEENYDISLKWMRLGFDEVVKKYIGLSNFPESSDPTYPFKPFIVNDNIYGERLRPHIGLGFENNDENPLRVIAAWYSNVNNENSIKMRKIKVIKSPSNDLVKLTPEIKVNPDNLPPWSGLEGSLVEVISDGTQYFRIIWNCKVDGKSRICSKKYILSSMQQVGEAIIIDNTSLVSFPVNHSSALNICCADNYFTTWSIEKIFGRFLDW